MCSLRAEAEGLEPTHQFPDTGFQDRDDTNYALHLQKRSSFAPYILDHTTPVADHSY